MPAFQLVPLPAVNYDIDFYWPPPQTAHNNGDAIDNTNSYHYGAAGAAGSLLSVGGGGTGNMSISAQGFPVMQVASLPLGQQFNVTFGGFNVRAPLFAGGVTPTMEYPVQYRVWRWQFVLMLQAVVAASLPYLTFVGFSNNGTGGPTAAGAGYFGLFLGTTGRWTWASRTGGAGGVGAFSEGPVDIGFPGSILPRLVDFVILSATASQAAQCLLYLDGQYGTPVISRSWGGLTPLPPYGTNGTPAGTSFQPNIFVRDGAVVTIVQAGCMRFMAGQFLPNGLQVF